MPTAEHQLQFLPQQVNVQREGGVVEVSAAELVPGDVVLLAEGAKVPADCRIVEAWGVRVNLATLTGEQIFGVGATNSCHGHG